MTYTLTSRKKGHQMSKKVIKCQTWVKSSIYGQIEPKSRNISNIHMFRLKILSKIQIQDYSRLIKVIRGQILVKMFPTF